MVHETTTGLRADGTAAADLQDIQWAIAAGTVNAITAVYGEPNTTLPDGLILGVRASGANTTTTPTFAPDGLTAHTITKLGGTALTPGDISAAGHELLLRYKLASTRWELLNPAIPAFGIIPWIAAGGTVDAITATYAPAIPALVDGLVLGVRASGANTTTTTTFAPNGLTAHTITKRGGTALVPGDISAAGQDLLLRYRLSTTQWELLNPSDGSVLRKVLNADDTGADSSTAQPWFPTAGGVTVLGATAYLFEGFLWTSRSAGTTSHTTGILFAGTATITDILYQATGQTGDAGALAAASSASLNAATELVVKAASTSATEQTLIRVRGIVRINAAGTFIPQFKYSAAPGGAPTVKKLSFFTMTPLGSNAYGTNGTWA